MIQLQTFQKSKSRVISDYKISLSRTDQAFSFQAHSNVCPSRYPSMFPKNRISLPHIPFMHAKHYSKRATHETESPLQPCPKSVVFKAPDIKEKLSKPDADYIPLELDDPDDSERDADKSALLGAVILHSTLKSSKETESPIAKQLNGKHSDHDSYHSHLLNQKNVLECETGQKNVVDHIMKESKSSLQNKGSKRKIQHDERSDVLSPRKICGAAKRVSFSTGASEVSVTSDKKNSSDRSSNLHASAENKDRAVEDGKEEACFSPQGIRSKERDVSAKRSKLMSLSFAERLRKQLAQSCSRNGESLVA